MIVVMVGVLIEDMVIIVLVVFYFDYGSSVECCRQVIDVGFSLVMIDGFYQLIDENIVMIKEVIDYVVKYGVLVEVEVGMVGGMEDGLVGGVCYVDIMECEWIVKEINIDVLVVVFGFVYGKYQGELNFGFKEMEVIFCMIDIFFVFYGVFGILQDQIKKVIMFGYVKININMECMVVWIDEICCMFQENSDLYELCGYLISGIEVVEEIV